MLIMVGQGLGLVVLLSEFMACCVVYQKAGQPKQTWLNLREAFFDIELATALPVKKLNVRLKVSVVIQIANKSIE